MENNYLRPFIKSRLIFQFLLFEDGWRFRNWASVKIWDISLNDTSACEEGKNLATWFFFWYVKNDFQIYGTHLFMEIIWVMMTDLSVAPLEPDKYISSCTASVPLGYSILFVPFLLKKYFKYFYTHAGLTG